MKNLSELVETNQDMLSAQTTADLKALLDYSKDQVNYFIQNEKYDMALKYKQVVKKLEDELNIRLESIFIF